MTNEKRIEMRTYIVRLYCKCGGEMEPTGIMLTTDPPYYPHRCNRCGKQEMYLDKAYPYIDYEEIAP